MRRRRRRRRAADLQVKAEPGRGRGLLTSVPINKEILAKLLRKNQLLSVRGAE